MVYFSFLKSDNIFDKIPGLIFMSRDYKTGVENLGYSVLRNFSTKLFRNYQPIRKTAFTNSVNHWLIKICTYYDQLMRR